MSTIVTEPDSIVPHQFDDLEQKNLADTLGMWTFLATEVLFFGALFSAFLVYRHLYLPDFVQASHHLLRSIGAINTAILLCSSYTVVLALHAARVGHNRALIAFLILTMALGGSFLGLKALEYYKDFQSHLVPGWPDFGMEPAAADSFHRAPMSNYPGSALHAWHDSDWHVSLEPALFERTHQMIRHAQLFYVFYYTMTAIHALHMIIGLGVFTFLLVRAVRGKYTPRKHAQIEMTGLYWHFVDIVWIFLFPVLYLMR